MFMKVLTAENSRKQAVFAIRRILEADANTLIAQEFQITMK